MIQHGLVIGRVINTPLLAHPRKALVVYNFLIGRLGLGGVAIPDPESEEVARIDALGERRSMPLATQFAGELVAADDDRKGIEPFRMTRDGVGLITVTGSLVNRGAWVGKSSGVTSYEGIKYQFQRAARHPKVKSIILDIESPGGEAVGAFETGRLIKAVSDEKPTWAVVNGMAASAAYALASGAKRIITTESGIAGSIGVVLLHLDWSKFLQEKGVQPTLIQAGAKKTVGNPYEPLSDDDASELQAEVDQYYGMFLDQVAAGRGRRLTKSRARETEARTYIGKASVEAGLADDLGTFEDVLHEARSRARRLSNAGTGSKAMAGLLHTDDDQAREVEAARAQGREDGLRAGREDGMRAGFDEGVLAGAAQERDRIRAVVTDPRVAANQLAALQMALNFPSATADSVATTLAAIVPAPAPGMAYGQAGATLASRVEATNVNRISAAPGSLESARANVADQYRTEEQAATAGWNTAVEAANKRVAAQKPKQRH